MSRSQVELREIPWEELAKHLRDRALALHSICAYIQSGFDRDNRNLILFNIGVRAATDVERASDWLNDGNDLLAWSVRNLYEVHLILRKLIQSDTSFQEWAGQMAKDEQQIVEGFEILRDSYSDAVNKRHDKVLQGLRETIDRLGIEMASNWRVDALARTVGREEEYRLFYKLLSKYVHPSSWIINSSPQRTNGELYRNLLAGVVQVLSGRIQNDLAGAFDLGDELKMTGKPKVAWRSSSYDKASIADLRKVHYALRRQLDAQVRRWKPLPDVPTCDDIAALEKFAMGDYFAQRFDWSSWPSWQVQAVRVYGAAEALRTLIDRAAHSQRDSANEAIVASLREDLGDELFDREYFYGKQLSWPAAVQTALSPPNLPP